MREEMHHLITEQHKWTPIWLLNKGTLQSGFQIWSKWPWRLSYCQLFGGTKIKWNICRITFLDLPARTVALRICMSDNSDSIRSHCNNSVVPCSIQGVFVFFGWLSLTGKCYQPTTASMSRLLTAWAPFSLHLSTLLPSSTSQWVEPLFFSYVHTTPIL